MGQPGKRAPTVEICESNQPYSPLAMRQHVTGPYPFDPSLVSQGIGLDDRATLNDHIYGPLDGTPLPPGPAPAAPAPADVLPAPPSGNAPVVAPSAFTPGANGPSVAVATYDPKTGQFATPDGTVARQTSMVSSGGPQNWTDLMQTG